jgi:hypothetical protein
MNKSKRFINKNKKHFKWVVLTNLILLLAFLGMQTVSAAEGDVWLSPTSQERGSSQSFDIEVHLDTNEKNLGAFNLYFDFNPTYISIDTAQGDSGISKGADTSSYSVMVNPDDLANGHLRFAGIAASGYANGANVHLVTIHAQTTESFVSGSATLDLRVNELTDELANNFSAGTITGATIEYLVSADITAPNITEFTIPATSTSLTVPVTFTASDDTAVTGYCLSEVYSSVGCSWAGSAPVEYIFASEGNKTLYAYAKDAAGNISSSVNNNDSVNITLPVYTIGGTISGLSSGAVVLQNNGGDDLSRSANGAFVFSTALHDATSFAVTVLTQPSGQTCVVSNGSGTVSGENITTVSVDCSDTSAPVFTINNGTATGPVKSDTINITATDSGTISVLEYGFSPDNVCNVSDTYGNTFSSGVNFDVAGNHSDYLCVTATDDSSNTVYQLVGQLNTDNTSPTIAEVTPVATPTNYAIHSYIFSTNEAGVISYGGDCTSSTTNATVGSNIITFSALSAGVHSNCTITVTDSASNASNVLAVTAFTIDVMSPEISGGLPNSAEISGTTTAVLSVTTDEAATCKYSTSAGVAYASMADTFSTTGGVTHTENVTVSDGNFYDFYIRCVDEAENVNDLDYSVQFSVAEAGDATAPVVVAVTSVLTPTTDTTPNYVFNSNEVGRITYEGDCISDTAYSIVGDNTITFDTLSVGTYSNCALTVTDASNNESELLIIASFTINPSSQGARNDDDDDDDYDSLKLKDIKLEVVSGDQLKITWKTNNYSYAYVRYGIDGNFREKKKDTNRKVKNHSMHLYNLVPGAKYYVRVYSDDGHEKKRSATRIISIPRKNFILKALSKTKSLIQNKPEVDSPTQSSYVPENSERENNNNQTNNKQTNNNQASSVQDSSVNNNQKDLTPMADAPTEVVVKKSKFKWWNPFTWF